MKDTLYMQLKELRLAWWRFCRECHKKILQPKWLKSIGELIMRLQRKWGK